MHQCTIPGRCFDLFDALLVFHLPSSIFHTNNSQNMKLTTLLYLSSFFVGYATSQTLSQCALACVSQAAVQDGCGSFTNTTCVCTNAQFQEDALTCLTDLCPSDLASLQALQAQECEASGLSATGTPTNTEPFTATGVSSGTGTSLSIPSTTASTGSAASAGSATSASSTGNATAASGSGTPTPTSGEARFGVPLGMSLGIFGMLMAGLLC